MRQGEGEVVIVLEEVEDGAREEPRNDADVVPVVEAVDKVNAFAVGNLERVANGQNPLFLRRRASNRSLDVGRITLA